MDTVALFFFSSSSSFSPSFSSFWTAVWQLGKDLSVLLRNLVSSSVLPADFPNNPINAKLFQLAFFNDGSQFFLWWYIIQWNTKWYTWQLFLSGSLYGLNGKLSDDSVFRISGWYLTVKNVYSTLAVPRFRCFHIFFLFTKIHIPLNHQIPDVTQTTLRLAGVKKTPNITKRKHTVEGSRNTYNIWHLL